MSVLCTSTGLPSCFATKSRTMRSVVTSKSSVGSRRRHAVRTCCALMLVLRSAAPADADALRRVDGVSHVRRGGGVYAIKRTEEDKITRI